MVKTFAIDQGWILFPYVPGQSDDILSHVVGLRLQGDGGVTQEADLHAKPLRP